MVLLFVPCGVDSLRILEKEKQAVEKGERRGIGIGGGGGGGGGRGGGE